MLLVFLDRIEERRDTGEFYAIKDLVCSRYAQYATAAPSVSSTAELLLRSFLSMSGGPPHRSSFLKRLSN